jgi:secreted protein with Ig-like and vWFA domain
MSPTSDEEREEFRRRLTHLALREVIGGDSPPDLSDRILAAAEEQTSESPQPKGEEVMANPKKRRMGRRVYVVAACATVLFLVTLLTVSGFRARSLAKLQSDQELMTEKTQPAVESEERGPVSHAVPWAAIASDIKSPGSAAPHAPIVTLPDARGAGQQSPSPQPYAIERAWAHQLFPSESQTGSGPLSGNGAAAQVTPPGYAGNQMGGYGGEMGGYGGEMGGYGVEMGGYGLGGYEGDMGGYGEGMGYGGGHVAEHGYGSPSQQASEGDAVYGGYGSDTSYYDAVYGKPESSAEGSGEYASEMGAASGEPSARSRRDRRRGPPEQNNGASAKAAQALAEWKRIRDARIGQAQGGTFQDEAKARAEYLNFLSLAQGHGPGRGGDQYVRLVENPFRAVKDHPLSTFSIDVDTASYANVRRFLMQENRLPPPDAVRIEELVNYFDYDYSGPTGDVPFASHIEVAGCPWLPEHRLVRIALKGYEIDANQRPKSNLVFLLDVSGSMSSNDKLPLLQQGMKLLAGQLGENDRVAIVVYAGSEGLVLPSTVGDQRAKVLDAIDRLKSGGSTNGGAGIELAYKIALENFIDEGVNRVILCTDGDFNVGTTSTGDLERMVEEKAKSGVFLSVLGFGRGNLNDAMMETISNKGNGNYAYIDGITEAQKVLVEQMGGTLVTIAKDVKIQVEFNPTQVEAYRLIGYENRMLAAEDFNDDKKDAGEIGAGHTVTALYELVPAGGKVELPDVDPLRYQVAPSENQDEGVADELLVLKLRYKEPDGDTSELLEFPTTDAEAAFSKASPDFQFAAAVASFGMQLRGSVHSGMSTYDAVLEIAESAKGADKHGYRAEFVEMVKRAREIVGPISSTKTRLKPDAADSDRSGAPEGLVGIVLSAEKSVIEISLGSDDGVLAGHHLDVVRGSTYLGKIEVINTKPDKAVCKVLPQFRKGVIEVSDRVLARGAEK